MTTLTITVPAEVYERRRVVAAQLNPNTAAPFDTRSQARATQDATAHMYDAFGRRS